MKNRITNKNSYLIYNINICLPPCIYVLLNFVMIGLQMKIVIKYTILIFVWHPVCLYVNKCCYEWKIGLLMKIIII